MPNEATMARLWRSSRWLMLILFLLWVGRYVWFNRNDFAIIFEVKRSYIVAIAIVHLAFFFLICLRYRLILNAFDFHIGFSSWLRVFTVSRFINTFIPHAGNIYRAAVLRSEFGLSLGTYVKSLMLFGYLDRLNTLALAIIALLLARSSTHVDGVPVVATLAFCGLVLVSLPVIAMFLNPLARLTYIRKFGERIVELRSEIFCILRSRTMFLWFNVAGFGNFCCALGANWLAFSALGVRLSLTDVILFCVLNIFIRLIHLTPGNVGVAEVSFGWLAHKLGVDVASAIIAASILNLVGYVVFFAAGILAGGGRYIIGRERGGG